MNTLPELEVILPLLPHWLQEALSVFIVCVFVSIAVKNFARSSKAQNGLLDRVTRLEEHQLEHITKSAKLENMVEFLYNRETKRSINDD